MRPSVRIRRSKTGLGLFATAPFRTGQPIVEYSGPRIPTREARAREQARGSRYMFEIDRHWTIDGSVRSNVARYANHACRPNAEAYLSKGRIMLRAIRPISEGEEITYDYGREYFDLFLKASGCRCASCARRTGGKSNKRG
jgi:SET domain-containing protein